MEAGHRRAASPIRKPRDNATTEMAMQRQCSGHDARRAACMMSLGCTHCLLSGAFSWRRMAAVERRQSRGAGASLTKPIVCKKVAAESVRRREAAGAPSPNCWSKNCSTTMPDVGCVSMVVASCPKAEIRERYVVRVEGAHAHATASVMSRGRRVCRLLRWLDRKAPAISQGETGLVRAWATAHAGGKDAAEGRGEDVQRVSCSPDRDMANPRSAPGSH